MAEHTISSHGVVPIASNLVPGKEGPRLWQHFCAPQQSRAVDRVEQPFCHCLVVGVAAALAAVDRPVSFGGLPVPIHCDKSYGACPIRLQGSGLVRFGDGTLLQSAIVFYDGVPKFPRATSVVVFRNTDGSWTGSIKEQLQMLPTIRSHRKDRMSMTSRCSTLGRCLR